MINDKHDKLQEPQHHATAEDVRGSTKSGRELVISKIEKAKGMRHLSEREKQSMRDSDDSSDDDTEPLSKREIIEMKAEKLNKSCEQVVRDMNHVDDEIQEMFIRDDKIN